MRSSRIAVIDVGTNTFHLLVVESDAGEFKEILRKRVFVKLAEEGIEELGEQAMERGLDTLRNFRKIIDRYDVGSWRVTGTAALRTASNGPAFMKQVQEIAGFEIELIDGRQEAQYIFEGVRQVWAYHGDPRLIMDIGGGSVEFIIANDREILWLESFPIGIAVLYRTFHRNDPITSSEIELLNQFLQDVLIPLKIQLHSLKPVRLVGASGTFDVLSSMTSGTGDSLYREIATATLREKLKEIINMTKEERLRAPSIPQDRVDMIVVAALLIEYMLEVYPFESVGFSSYALKEGLLAEILQV